MKLRCVNAYKSQNGKYYDVGDIIYFSEYLSLASGEENNWHEVIESNPIIF